MEPGEKFLVAFITAWREVISTITLPTGKQLVPSTIFAAIITVVSVLNEFFWKPYDWFFFVDWRGALIATLTLTTLLFIERRGYVEVSRLYRIAKSRAKDIAERAKRPGADAEDAGGLNPGDPEP